MFFLFPFVVAILGYRYLHVALRVWQKHFSYFVGYALSITELDNDPLMYERAFAKL